MTLFIVFGLVYVAGALTATVLLLWLEIRTLPNGGEL